KGPIEAMVVQPPGFVVAAKLIDRWLSAPSSRCFHHVNDVGFFIFELVIVHAEARVTLLRAIEFQFKRSNGPSWAVVDSLDGPLSYLAMAMSFIWSDRRTASPRLGGRAGFSWSGDYAAIEMGTCSGGTRPAGHIELHDVAEPLERRKGARTAHAAHRRG